MVIYRRAGNGRGGIAGRVPTWSPNSGRRGAAAAHQVHHQGQHEEDDEDDEEDLRGVDGNGGDTTEAEEGCHDGAQEEEDGPAHHAVSFPDSLSEDPWSAAPGLQLRCSRHPTGRGCPEVPPLTAQPKNRLP